MEEAAARAAAEEGVASGSANGVLAASEAPSGEAPRSPGSGLKAGGRRKRRGKRATPEARAEPSEGRAAPKQLKCTAEALSRSAAAAGPAADRHNAGARAGASVAAALDGESQLSASRAGSHSRGALDVSAGAAHPPPPLPLRPHHPGLPSLQGSWRRFATGALRRALPAGCACSGR